LGGCRSSLRPKGRKTTKCRYTQCLDFLQLISNRILNIRTKSHFIPIVFGISKPSIHHSMVSENLTIDCYNVWYTLASLLLIRYIVYIYIHTCILLHQQVRGPMILLIYPLGLMPSNGQLYSPI
jgi:tellurite resistance protein TehA-like permease